jgi:multidrug resistance efflux pump
MLRWILSALSLAGIVLAITVVLELRKTPPANPPRRLPPVPVVKDSPIASPISATGVVEAKSENIFIGTNLPGVVEEVFVKVDDTVKPGQPLFRLDDRQARADLKAAEARLAVADAQLQRLRNAPRPEDIPPAQAFVEESVSKLEDADVAWQRAQQLLKRGSISQSDYDRDRYAYSTAKAVHARAIAELAKLKAGSWDREIAVAQAEVASAKATMEGARVNLERHTVNALVPAQVLQVNVRPGQYAGQLNNTTLLVLGDTGTLHVRADIDEQDLDRFVRGSKAFAYLRGRSEPVFELTPYRVEPYVIPKRNLTGENSERIDTRVLQVIYALPGSVKRGELYVGQQMDVFIEAKPFESDKSRFEAQKKAATEVSKGPADKPEAPASKAG